MARVDVSPEEAEFIRACVRRFDVEASAEQQWLIPYVRDHRALPLYLGWTETIGLRPDGALVSWSTEGDWPGTKEVADDMWSKVALVTGAQRYPRLSGLVPTRPASATTCDACNGTGVVELAPECPNICQCGGVGWIADAT